MPTAVVAGTVGAVGLLGGASASQSAANAQSQMANAQLQYQSQQSVKAQAVAAPSFDQMQQLHQQYAMSSNLLDTQLTNLQSQYQLYQSASSQAKALMEGKSASTLAPLQQQQKQQRIQLENRLREQLGPGYETSSAGAMALANFDMQTQSATATAQAEYTGMFLGASQGLGAQYTQGLNSAYSTAANIGSSANATEQNIKGLQVQAITGTPVNFNNSVATAGAGSVGAAQGFAGLTGLAGNVLGNSSSWGGTTGGGVGGGGTGAGNGSNIWAGGNPGTAGQLLTA